MYRTRSTVRSLHTGIHVICNSFESRRLSNYISKVALGFMAIRTQNELMIRRVQFIRRTKEAATQAACAGNIRGYHSEYGNSWFNNRENDDAYVMFRYHR